MAIEYLARQQGEHQNLINELLAREPGEKVVQIIERDGPGGTANSKLSKPASSLSRSNKNAASNVQISPGGGSHSALQGTTDATGAMNQARTPLGERDRADGAVGVDMDVGNGDGLGPMQNEINQNKRLLGAL